jgi:DtxR family Mn-dependent transcriptional regulator
MGARRETLEELLELWWTAGEDGLLPLNRQQLPERLRCYLPDPIDPGEDPQQAIDELLRLGRLTAEGELVDLSPSGRAEAGEIIRRHRLAEVLLRVVLDVSETAMESTACKVEHVLTTEVTDAVCAFLGHPPACPHGRAIPAGRCCQAAAGVEPLIVPLAELAVGQEGTVAFIHSKRQAYLQRLSAMGVAPGRVVRVRQRQPSLVIRLGETELALDRLAGEEILVRRRPQAAPAPRQPGSHARPRFSFAGLMRVIEPRSRRRYTDSANTI